MSTRLPEEQRRALDAYYTPDDVATKIVQALPIEHPRKVWEPHVGGGAFARALKARFGGGVFRLHASDIDPDAPGLEERDVVSWHGNCLDHSPDEKYDLIIGNPPFKHAEEHIRHFLSLEPHRCVMLLRLAFLASMKRQEFWEDYPVSRLFILSKRPSFTGGGTDSSDYAAFVWEGKHMTFGVSKTWGWHYNTQEILWL